MAEPLLSKDSINIGGHKLPIALVGALAAVFGVLVVMRARQSGANVAGAGAQAAPGYGSLGPSSFAPDNSAALANLSQQLTGIQQQLNQPPAQPAAPPAPAPPPVITGMPPIAPAGFGTFVTASQQPVFGSPGGPGSPPWSTWLADLPVGTRLWFDTNPVLGFENSNPVQGSSPLWERAYLQDPTKTSGIQPIGFIWAPKAPI